MVVVGVVLAGIVFIIVASWWADGSMGATDALILFTLYGGLLFVLFAASSVAVRLIALTPLAVSACWGAYALRKGSLRSYYRDQVRLFRLAINADPRNLAARRQLAETLYKLGDLDGAVLEMQSLASISTSSTEIRYIIKQWEAEKREQDTGIVVCSRCKTENGPGVNWCRKCEAPLMRVRKKSWLTEAGLKGYILTISAMTITALSFAFLPTTFAFIPIGCFILAIAGWRLTLRQ